MQYGFFAVDNQGVTGIMAALKSRNDGHLIGQQINDLALSFVTPLSA